MHVHLVDMDQDPQTNVPTRVSLASGPLRVQQVAVTVTRGRSQNPEAQAASRAPLVRTRALVQLPARTVSLASTTARLVLEANPCVPIATVVGTPLLVRAAVWHVLPAKHQALVHRRV